MAKLQVGDVLDDETNHPLLYHREQPSVYSRQRN
jgi:hypothetical protein